MKILGTLSVLIASISLTSITWGQLSVSNPDFTDIDWWTANGGMAAGELGLTDTDGANPMETYLGINWRSNPVDVPGRDGPRSFLLGSNFSPTTGRSGFASLALIDNGQVFTYLGQATQTGTITIQWSSALRSDVALAQNNLSFQFQTSTVGDFSATFVDAGLSSSYDEQSIVLSDTEWQTVQFTSGVVNKGDHVYFYWFANDGSPSNQTLIQNISISSNTPYAILDVYSVDSLGAETLLESFAVPNPGPNLFMAAELTTP